MLGVRGVRNDPDRFTDIDDFIAPAAFERTE